MRFMTPDAPREDFLLALPGIEMPAAAGFHQRNRHGPLIIANHECGLPVCVGRREGSLCRRFHGRERCRYARREHDDHPGQLPQKRLLRRVHCVCVDLIALKTSGRTIGLAFTLLMLPLVASATRGALFSSGPRGLRPWRRRRGLRLRYRTSRGRRALGTVTTVLAGLAHRGTLAHAIENMRSRFDTRARLHRRGSCHWSAWQRALFAADTIGRIRPIGCGIGVRLRRYVA